MIQTLASARVAVGRLRLFLARRNLFNFCTFPVRDRVLRAVRHRVQRGAKTHTRTARTADLEFCCATEIDHPSLRWRAIQLHLGWWREAHHASFPASLRRIILTLLVVARSEQARTQELSHGLRRVSTATLYVIFRWIGRLNYFE